MRIILTEFGDLSIKEIEEKVKDESIPIRERAVLATWVRAQRDQRAFDSIMSRMYGQPVQHATIANPDGTPLKRDVVDLSGLSDDDLAKLLSIREKAEAAAAKSSSE